MHLFNRKSFERADEGRRRVLRMAALATLFAARPGAYADELTRTPEQTEGPFFPDRLPSTPTTISSGSPMLRRPQTAR